MNLPITSEAEIMELLPSLTSPTVSHLVDPDWIAIEVILEESEIKRLIPALKRAGAAGIIEYPLNKVVD
jgi:ATP phosphoribosyltransferase